MGAASSWIRRGHGPFLRQNRQANSWIRRGHGPLLQQNRQAANLTIRQRWRGVAARPTPTRGFFVRAQAWYPPPRLATPNQPTFRKPYA